MLDFESLNEPQRDCVETLEGPVVLLAGAGTGKTRVIIYRIAHMISRGYPRSQIVALTFTNKAAGEMKERLKLLIGDRSKDVWVGTFHSYCLTILRKFWREAGLEKHFSIIGISDQRDLVRKCLAERNWLGIYQVAGIHAMISQAKNQLLTDEDVANSDLFSQGKNGCDPDVLAEVLRLYERQLRLHHAIDFDDCIYRTVKLLEKNQHVCEILSRLHQFFLVDEFQDTNFSQLKIIELLAQNNRHVCVVGDDDQSIYSWRGAMAEVLFKFEEIFPERKLIKLEENYRCTGPILHAANTVIKNNKKRKDKTLWTSKTLNHPIELVSKETEADEAAWVGSKCLALLGRGLQYKDIAILYRSNAQAKPLELAMREAKLRYKVYGGQSFFERKEIKDVLAYLKLVANPHDRHAFWRIINTPSRGIGLKTLERANEVAKEKGVSPFSVFEKHDDLFSAKVARASSEFCAKVRNLNKQDLKSPDDLKKIASTIIKDFSLTSEIRQSKASENIIESKIQTLLQTPDWLAGIAEKVQNHRQRFELGDILDVLSLGDESPSSKSEASDHISLMTIHAAKGLEFRAVFLVGVEEDLLPHKHSTETMQGIEEERRLFYVALTRAKEFLFLSKAEQRGLAKQSTFPKASRFLAELPNDEFIIDERSKKTQQSEESKKTRTLGRLSSLRRSMQKDWQQ